MARYDRYDTSLRVERGQVTSGMSPNYNDYRASYGYGRDFDPRNTTYWRRPWQLRGDVRAGAAFSYGFGSDYDRVYRNTTNRAAMPRGRRDDFARGYDVGYHYRGGRPRR